MADFRDLDLNPSAGTAIATASASGKNFNARPTSLASRLPSFAASAGQAASYVETAFAWRFLA